MKVLKRKAPKSSILQNAIDLYEIRGKIAALKVDEENLRKEIIKHYKDPVVFKYIEKHPITMEVVTDEVTILKPNNIIADKIGLTEFVNLAKVGIGDLKKYCEEEGFRFKWFISNKKGVGATKIIFTNPEKKK